MNVKRGIKNIGGSKAAEGHSQHNKGMLRDDEGRWTGAGDTVWFSYGIPPVVVHAEIIERDGKLIGLCPEHNPPAFNLRLLRRYVVNWYKLNN